MTTTAWMTDQAGSHQRHSSVVIDLAAIRANYAFLKSLSPEDRLFAVIKADAYGHGAVEVARALPEADAFAVATVMEAETLRRAGINHKIIVLGGALCADEMDRCAKLSLDPVLHQHCHIEWLADLEDRSEIEVWIKLNSGMGRLGFSTDEFVSAVKRVAALPNVSQVRLMSHLASADNRDSDKTRLQLQVIRESGLEDYEWSIANSAGLLAWPASRAHWSRTGIALYGCDPMQRPEFNASLQPVMAFSSQVLAINAMAKGESIGYGSLYTCPADKVIAVVAAGYADGYPRHLQNGHVAVGGVRAPVVGRVSMDMITIDITGLTVNVGDEVVLWGTEPLAAEVAEKSETIAYELFCHAGCHGQKRYINRT